MDEAGRAYESEMRRIAAAGMPGIIGAARQYMGTVSPTPLSGLNVPTQPVANRIAEACRQLVEAGQELQSARAGYRESVERKEQWEQLFAQISGELMKLIHEHREGTPEGVPYQAEGMR